MNIEINFRGRLGNQMFQYAFGYNLSKIYNCNLYIKKHAQCTLDKIFGIELKKSNIPPENKKHIKETECHKKENDCYKEGFEKEYHSLLDNTYLFDGYWQNENYFKESKNEIKLLYTVPKFDIQHNDLVIHVRRGDYVNNPKFFYCDLNWYETAISYFNFDRLHIVSDDTEWCAKSFAKYSPIIPNMKELETLGYISSFNNIIISNSSFGWWGAYLSNTDNVVCPGSWDPHNKCWKTAKNEWIKLSKP